MTRILVIERSPLVATDIVETVRGEIPEANAMTVDNIDAAVSILDKADVIDLCIVSGSAARDRLQRLRKFLDDRRVKTIAISEDAPPPDVYPDGTAHLSQPFTSQMLIQAVRQVSRDA